MRKRRRTILTVLLAFAAWATFERWSHNRLAPPPEVATLDAFLRWRPETTRVLVLSPGGHEHLCALGPKAGLLPSGPSAYVFDGGGKFVDWTADTGDDLAFRRKWGFDKPVGELGASDATRRTAAERAAAHGASEVR